MQDLDPSGSSLQVQPYRITSPRAGETPYSRASVLAPGGMGRDEGGLLDDSGMDVVGGLLAAPPVVGT
jgi:hypothetical protein